MSVFLIYDNNTTTFCRFSSHLVSHYVMKLSCPNVLTINKDGIQIKVRIYVIVVGGGF